MIDGGEVVLGDRGYGTAKSIFYAREFGGHVLVRVTPYNIRVCSTDREIIRMEEYEKLVPEIGCYSMHVLIPVPPNKTTKSKKTWPLKDAIAWIPARLVGSRNDEGEVIWIITTLPENVIDDATVMQHYRIRWQVELLYKRLKSLAWLDKLPAPHKGPTAMSWIVGRLLVAALVEAMNDVAHRSFSP
jgi:IS4 transposase